MSSPVLQSLFEPDHRVAVIDGGQRYSFLDVQQSSRILATRLNRLNPGPGGRFAALLPNSLHAVAAFLAVARTGHGYLPLNIGLKPAELESYFHKCRVKAVICRHSIKSHIPSGMQIVTVDDILNDANSEPEDISPELDPDREFICLSTSGSTGKPRVVARTARAVDANTRQVSAGLQVTAKDRFLSVVPFWHANGFSNCLLMPLLCRASIITMDRFLPRPMSDLILSEKPTVVVGSPFVFRALAQVLEPRSDLGHVRAWISSGAALPAELDKRLRNLGIQVRQLYGSSETGTISISSATQSNGGNVGKPLQGVQVRIMDDGREVPPGQVGEIQVSGAALFSGYIGEANEEPGKNADGFRRMGDLGWQNQQGELYLTGRADSMINVSGVKVDPLEIQQVLKSMPGVEQALVYGAPDANGLEMIKTLLVVTNVISTDEVLRYCRNRLAEYKLPRSIKFVDEIPQNLMGKTARSLLEN